MRDGTLKDERSGSRPRRELERALMPRDSEDIYVHKKIWCFQQKHRHIVERVFDPVASCSRLAKQSSSDRLRKETD